jgi:hypothetical protein
VKNADCRNACLLKLQAAYGRGVLGGLRKRPPDKPNRALSIPAAYLDLFPRAPLPEQVESIGADAPRKARKRAVVVISGDGHDLYSSLGEFPDALF